MNRHDAWNKHVREHAEVIAETRLPVELFRTERTLAEFLTVGRSDHPAADLESVADESFAKLCRFAYDWFDMDAATFTAMRARCLRASRPRLG